jgi:hypothetical protein
MKSQARAVIRPQTVLVNGQLVDSALTAQGFRAAVDAANPSSQ